MSIIDWNKHYVRQEDGFCGPAVIKMILSAVGIDKSQAEIAADTYISWWGTHSGVMLAYLSRFFSDLGFMTDATLEDIENHLRDGHFVIVDWWDDLDQDPADPPDGHYSIVDSIDRTQKTIKLIDSSHRGIWDMKLSEFQPRWRDTLDVNQKLWLNRFLLWLAPSARSMSRVRIEPEGEW